VLKERDEERRSIARDLHESTSQNLIYASLLAAKIQKALPEASQPAADEMHDVIRQSVADLRTVSHLLHPPLLDEAGLPLALRAYINKYAQTHALAVHVDVVDDMERLPPDVELVLFRVMQEALGIISRHAVNRTASIRLRRERAAQEVAVLSVEYEGRSPPRRKHVPALIQRKLQGQAMRGIQLTGIRERLLHVGGRLEVVIAPRGTVFSAIVPVS
jgi:signal transduction histidine kinase